MELLNPPNNPEKKISFQVCRKLPIQLLPSYFNVLFQNIKPRDKKKTTASTERNTSSAANIYLFKVNNRNNRESSESVVDFEQVNVRWVTI